MSKILHVVNISFVIPYFFGGQIDYFKRLGYQIHIACSPDNDLFKLSDELGFQPYGVLIKRRFSPFQDLRTIYRLYTYIKKNSISIIIGHTPKGALLAMIAAYLSGSQIRIYVRHGLVYQTLNGVTKIFMMVVERVISALATKSYCVSNSVYVQSLADKISSKWKCEPLIPGSYNGVDARIRFNPSLVLKNNHYKLMRLKENYGLKEDDFVVGFVGRLSRDKGVEELIKAWLDLNLKNAKLLLVGPSDERDPISSVLIKQAISEESILFIPKTTEIELFYSLFDLFILPSKREGFPTVVLEASSMEIPVITTKSTGCIDSIKENVTGKFIQLNPESIGESILFFYDRPWLLRQYGKSGRKWILNNFNQEKIWESFSKKIIPSLQ